MYNIPRQILYVYSKRERDIKSDSMGRATILSSHTEKNLSESLKIIEKHYYCLSC